MYFKERKRRRRKPQYHRTITRSQTKPFSLNGVTDINSVGGRIGACNTRIDFYSLSRCRKQYFHFFVLSYVFMLQYNVSLEVSGNLR